MSQVARSESLAERSPDGVGWDVEIISPTCGAVVSPGGVVSGCRLVPGWPPIQSPPRAMRAIFSPISSGDNTKSTHPLSIALSGMSGCLAVSGF